ncbi:MAG: MFS transporter [Bacteroidetes bacterium]|nr:MFS transporter [Bacteroidota bacterium]
MSTETFRIYGYRWVVLSMFMCVVVVNQLLWITFAPVTGTAAAFYGVSDLSIGMLSMAFMVVYIFVSIPASWVIDTYGLRIAVGIGAGLTGIFGLMRGIFSDDFTWVLIAQIGIAIGQPFLLNAMTTVAARWFPIRERAIASGLGSLASYLGIVIGMALTPILVIHSGIHSMLLDYGIISVVAAILFLLLAREKPPTPACPPGQEERSLVFDGLKNMLKKKNYILLLIIFFFGLGVFNAVATWIEEIVRPRGFSITQAGMAGGLMILGGLVGAAIISWLSDHYRRRVPFILLALGVSGIGLLGITFATSYPLLLASSFVMGFFLLSAGPVGFQYGAEVAYPAPEGTSNGLLLMMGQISGILFIFGMDGFKSGSGSMTQSLIILVGLMVVAFLMALNLRESSLLTGKADK